MAKKNIEYYICDRCKEEIENYSEKDNQVCDGFNGYFYDLCNDCLGVFEDYKRNIEEVNKQFKDITKTYKFGKYMFEDKESEKKC